MSIKDLVPEFRKNRIALQKRPEETMDLFQQEMNRLFDNFFGDFGLTSLRNRFEPEQAEVAPRLNVSESDREVKVTAELPGMDEKDVSVELEDDILTISGERKEEHEEKNKQWHRLEQSYGSFHRSIQLPAKVDSGKAKARFKKGLLTIDMPKLPEEQNNRKKVNILSE